MTKPSLKSRLYNSKRGNSRPPFTKLYISNKKSEYNLRFICPESVDPMALPFKNVYIHGGFFHPNYENQKFPGKFRCIGRTNDCPLCKQAWDEFNYEKENNVARTEKQAWKKRGQKYAIYWAENRDTGELCLVHIQDFAFSKDTETLQDILFKKLEGAAIQDIDPFDIEHGHDVQIKITLIDKKAKYTITVMDEESTVSNKNLQYMKLVPMFEDVYKKYDQEYLQNIVDGKKINYSQTAKAETKVKTEKEDVNTESFDESVDPAVDDFNLEDDIEGESENLMDQLSDLINEDE